MRGAGILASNFSHLLRLRVLPPHGVSSAGAIRWLRKEAPTCLKSTGVLSLSRLKVTWAMGGEADFQPSLARQPPASPLHMPSTLEKYVVAVCQVVVTENKDLNIANAKAAIEAATDKGAKLIVLPEIWNCPYARLKSYVEDSHGSEGSWPSSAMLAEVARDKGVTIVGGSVPEISNGHIFNTCYIFGSDGKLLGKHRKVHLFDLDIPGKITFRESDTLTAGEGLTCVDTDVGAIGVGICYDIRFPEMAMLEAAKGIHLLVYPGAFNMTTGPVHWELLLKARAVDNQVYVVGCSPARDPEAGYIAWGHSTIVGPFGEILATTEHQVDTLFGEINFPYIKEIRQNMPLESQRRGDLYTLLDKRQG